MNVTFVTLAEQKSHIYNVCVNVQVYMHICSKPLTKTTKREFRERSKPQTKSQRRSVREWSHGFGTRAWKAFTRHLHTARMVRSRRLHSLWFSHFASAHCFHLRRQEQRKDHLFPPPPQHSSQQVTFSILFNAKFGHWRFSWIHSEMD